MVAVLSDKIVVNSMYRNTSLYACSIVNVSFLYTRASEDHSFMEHSRQAELCENNCQLELLSIFAAKLLLSSNRDLSIINTGL